MFHFQQALVHVLKNDTCGEIHHLYCTLNDKRCLDETKGGGFCLECTFF